MRKNKDRTNEEGMTLVEMIVAMGILTVLLVISLSAVVALTKSTVRAQAVANATDQLRVTFQRFDKEVRYASAINIPGFSDEDYYVEYLVEASVKDGAATCVQWRLNMDTAELQRRTWSLDSTEASAWQTTVTGVRNDLSKKAEYPFTVQRAGTVDGKVYNRHQLEINLDTGMGEGKDARGGQLVSNFVAQNSSTTSPNTVCLNGAIGRS